eukprot:GHVN01020370.1.p1 GENE.GHVN01020370.1~~GHVN01020370.1.p1  ORF type:complete len:446 (+),score=62.17 GHVN01020370.1:54-1391(+)
MSRYDAHYPIELSHSPPTERGDGPEREEIELGYYRGEDRVSLLYPHQDDEENGPHSVQVRPVLFTEDPLTEEAPIEGDVNKEDFIDWAISVLCGLVIGFVMVKTLTYLPQAMFLQLKFQNWQLLKTLLSASGTLMAGSVILSLTRESFQNKRYGSKGFLSAGIGGLCLGIGIALCGCSPGFEWIQVGSGIWFMGFVAVGALVGAVTYSFLDEYVSKPLEGQAHPEHTNLDGMIGTDFWKVATPVAVLLICCAVGLEVAVPFGDDYPKKPNIPTKDAPMWFKDVEGIWPPYTAGLFIGLMAIFMKLGYGTRLSFHSVYNTTVGMILRPLLGDKCPDDLRAATHKSNLNEYFMLAGTALGAFLAADVATDPSLFEITKGCQWYWGLGGGFVSIFGARLGGGDLLAHGVSGVGDLNVTSLTATACIFLGGFLTTMLLKVCEADPFKAS